MTKGRDVRTGLYTYDDLIHRLEKRAAGRRPLAVVLFDLDFFHNIANRIGQQEGDAVLDGIAALLGQDERLRAAHKTSDEFVLLLEGAAAENAENIAQEYRRRLAKTKWIGLPAYHNVPIKASFGVAVASPYLHTAFLLLKAAEIALQTAKKCGRNRVETAPDHRLCLLREGRCHTVVGHSLRGSCAEGTPAFEAAIAEPYGLDMDRRYGLVFVDRSNHQIKHIFNQRVYSLAGNGSAGYQGDGGHPARAQLCKPSGVAVHRPTGDLYIADTGNHCIRRIRRQIITTIAGDGESGYQGDGGMATMAGLCRPGGVAVDDAGNVYTNDYGNNVIRRISAEGIITTVAGNGQYGHRGDDGPAVQAELNKPYGLCVSADGRWLFIADYGNHSVRCVDMYTRRIVTLCGTGEAGYAGDGGPANEAQLNGPYWVALYTTRYLLIADGGNHCIRRVDLMQGTIDTLAGNGQPGYIDTAQSLCDVRFRIPAGLAVEHHWVYVADYGNNAIRAICLEEP